MAFNCYMHERNIYKNRPDFAQIALDYPLFRKFAIPDSKGKVRIDFSDTDALRMLTEILLKKDFNLNIQIPQGFLIPTIPQRLNYILWIEDILSNISQINEKITGIDIGTGPCAIFPVLGVQKNGWNFIATETSDDALEWAIKNIEKNNLMSSINVVKVSPNSTLSEILSTNDSCYEFCMCNPPFFENGEEIRKKHSHSTGTIADVAQKEEIFVKGGEVDFVKNLLKESLVYKDRIHLFTSMFGKKRSFLEILEEIKKIEDAKVTTTEFYQGNTVRWGIAWSFDSSVQFQEVKKKKAKPKTAKQPLTYEILTKKCEKDIHNFVNQAKCILKELEIPFTTTRSSKHFVELLLKSEKNTWTHLRRKRREQERQKNCEKNSPNKLIASDEIVASLKSITDDNTKAFETDSNDMTSTNKLPQNESNDHHNPVEKIDCTEMKIVSKQSEKDSNILNKDTCKPVSEMCDELEMKEIDSKPSPNSDDLNDHIKNSEQSRGEKRKIINCEDSHVSKRAKFNIEDESKCTGIKQNENSLNNEVESPPSVQNELEINVVSSRHSCNDPAADSELLQKTERKENSCHNCSFVPGESKFDNNGIESAGLEKDLLLHCYLRLNKGKKKIYVNMNCPPTADRNTMYQVFQVLKNKLK